MPARKRARDEVEASEPPKEMGLLDKLRNMWEFSSLAQYIYIFGKVVKIDEDFDIEVPKPTGLATLIMAGKLVAEKFGLSDLLT